MERQRTYTRGAIKNIVGFMFAFVGYGWAGKFAAMSLTIRLSYDNLP